MFIELLSTIVGLIMFFSLLYFVVNTILEAIGSKVHQHRVSNENDAMIKRQEASLQDYLAMKKLHEEWKNPVPTPAWLTKEQYHSYLKSDKWKAKVKMRLAIDQYQCQHCGSEVMSRTNDSHIPNIHHFHYRNVTQENVIEDLVTLCQYCHGELHEKFSLEKMEVEIKTNGVANK